MPREHTSSRTTPILLAALAAGVAGNLLLRGGQWRAGFALWIAALACAVLVIGGRADRERGWLLAGISAAAFGLAWRDAPMLYAIDMLSVLCTGALLLWHGTGRSIRELTLVQTARAGIIAAMNTSFGAPGLLARGESTSADAGSARRTVRGLLVGVALAAIPTFLVTGLLASSDVIFQRTLDTVFGTVLHDGVSHLLISALLAWITAGWFRAALGEPIGSFVPEPESPRLPFITVSVVLYTFVVLLTLFVITQGRVLFGGAEFLRSEANLTVATYAREGFFQLIAASGVVLATLVLAEWLLTDDDAAARRQYRIVSVVLLVLVTLLLVSSATRIALYMGEFGLSVDRAFASAAILWVFAVLVAFAFTTLRNHPARFMSSAIVVTVCWVAVMNIANPEAQVVRVNVARAASGASFDATYHAHLSADAMPVLLAEAPRLGPAACAAVHAELRTWWAKRLADPDEGNGDWRSSNLPLVRARRWFATQGASASAAPRDVSAGC